MGPSIIFVRVGYVTKNRILGRLKKRVGDGLC